MHQNILNRLLPITEEEQKLLGGSALEKERYTSKEAFVVDSEKLLEKGKLIEVRPHTRFVHFPRHRHNYVELIYMCSGSTTHLIGEEVEITLHAGDLLFLNQSAYHEILPAGQDDLAVNFIILPEFFNRSFAMLEKENVLRDFLVRTLAGEVASSEYLYIRAGDILPVQNLLENMIWTLLEHPVGSNTLNQTTMGLVLQNLTLFADSINSSAPQKREENAVFRALKYIETDYQTASLAEAASLTAMPSYRLSKLLKKNTGRNFKDLLGERRLQQAAYLLENTSLSADRIMEKIGYENSSYFYHRFRDKYGCSPAKYREKQNGRREKT